MANFEIEYPANEPKAKIKVIGAGGAGGNAVNAMIDKGLGGVEFIVVNTDSQDLKKSAAQNRSLTFSRLIIPFKKWTFPDLASFSY